MSRTRGPAFAGICVLALAAGWAAADDDGPAPTEHMSIRADVAVDGAPSPHLDVMVTDPGEVGVGDRVSHQLTIRPEKEDADLGDPRIAERVSAETGEGELLVGSYTSGWREFRGQLVRETTADDRSLVATPDAPVIEEVTLFTEVGEVAVSEGRYVLELPLDMPHRGPGPATLVLTYDVETAEP